MGKSEIYVNNNTKTKRGKMKKNIVRLFSYTQSIIISQLQIVVVKEKYEKS